MYRGGRGAGASFALLASRYRSGSEKRCVSVQRTVKIGLVPDSGASFFLTHLIGEARARALAMLGDTINAGHCRRLGNDLESG